MFRFVTIIPFEFLDNRSVAVVYVGRVRAERFYHNRRGYGPDHVFRSIAGQPKELGHVTHKSGSVSAAR